MMSKYTSESLEEVQNRTRKKVITEYSEVRKAKAISQRQLADMAEISRPNVTRFESGGQNASLDFLVKLANCMDMDLEIHLVERKK